MTSTGYLYLILIGLPVFLLIYRLVPVKFQKPLLLIVSFAYYFIYSDFKLAGICFLAGSIFVNFIFDRLIKKAKKDSLKKFLLGLIVILNAAALVAVKLMKFSIVGISFYTFTVIAMQVDMFKSGEKEKAGNMAVYLSAFPRLAMGPITRLKDLKESISQLSEKHGLTLAGLSTGLETFIMGLGMKVLIADQLSTIWTGIRASGVNGITWQTAWLGAFVYTMELYLDFWGYSLIAIGLGQMIGLPLPKNFDMPYASKTVSEFWRRWHVTLGAWFKDYIYIPLGGNRKGKLRTAVNLLVVWLVTALWHGIGYNFIAWGMVLYILILLEKYTPLGKLKDTKVLGHVYIIFIMPVTWMLFAHENFNEMWAYIKCMFGMYGSQASPARAQFLRYMRDSWYLILLGILGTMPLIEKIYLKIKDSKWMNIAYLCIFWAAIYVLYTSSSKPFMYAAF